MKQDKIIVPQNYKKSLIKKLSKQNNLYKAKILGIDEVTKRLLFDYDEKTIYYLIKEKNHSYENAKELIKNMYFIKNTNYQNDKLNNLVTLKNKLLEKNLLTTDKFFKNSIKNKNVEIQGFINIDKWTMHIIDLLKETANVTITNIPDKNYTHPVYEFTNINNEIEFIANDIIQKNLDLNKVYIANINADNTSVIKRIFANYHLPINIESTKTLYETTEGLNFLNNLDLEKVQNEEIKNGIIKVLNKYSFIKDITEIKGILKEEFKHTKLKSEKLTNSINVIDLKNNIPEEDDYIYLINLNKETIPHNYKDEDYISDNEKMPYLDQTYQKNNNEFIIWKKILNNTKN